MFTHNFQIMITPNISHILPSNTGEYKRSEHVQSGHPLHVRKTIIRVCILGDPSMTKIIIIIIVIKK